MAELQAGLVIRYAYLWREEADAGRDEAVKDRPCAVVLATKRSGDNIVLVVAPITHTPPRDAAAAIEIPAATKARLGLDRQRSWIVTNQANAFTWPGPDIRRIDQRKPTSGYVYGQLPGGLTRIVIESLRTHISSGRMGLVHRAENTPPRRR